MKLEDMLGEEINRVCEKLLARSWTAEAIEAFGSDGPWYMRTTMGPDGLPQRSVCKGVR